jgi:hypothetical protein
LISIGLIADTGDTFYAELTDYDPDQIDDWLQENVLNNLVLTDRPDNTLVVSGHDVSFKGTQKSSKILGRWLNQQGPVEIWSDCLAYDWVLFNEIFGHAFKIPKNVLHIPFYMYLITGARN